MTAGVASPAMDAVVALPQATVKSPSVGLAADQVIVWMSVAAATSAYTPSVPAVTQYTVVPLTPAAPGVVAAMVAMSAAAVFVLTADLPFAVQAT